MSISVQIQGAVDAARDYYARSQRAKDARPALDRIVDFWLLSEQRQFDSGANWPPIKAKSRNWKVRRGLDPRVMRATGLLERTLTQPNAPNQMADAEADGLTVGIRAGQSDVFYAQRLVKKWPLVVFDDQAASDATELLGRWLEDGAIR